MILEVAILNVRPGLTEEFETNFRIASGIISKADGFIDLQLQKCLEKMNQYLLLVHWKDLKSHTEGFRESVAYGDWKKLLHHFYEPFPTVEHYSEVVKV